MMKLKCCRRWTTLIISLWVCIYITSSDAMGGALPAPTRPVLVNNDHPLDMLKSFLPKEVPVLFKADHPIDVVKRIPVAIMEGGTSALLAFLQTAMVMTPAGLIWKFSALRSNGPKAWAVEALKMGVEWGSFSASYSVRRCRIRCCFIHCIHCICMLY